MTIALKKLEDLGPDDFLAFPVWEFALDQEGAGETLMRPVTDLPADHMLTRIVGTKATLADGSKLWIGLENLDPGSAYKTKHLLSVAVFNGQEWFPLDRYHDYDLKNHGPHALARFLGKTVEQVFPIRYDVTSCVVGPADALRGFIESDPQDKLTREQVLDLVSKD